jgi:hypothetical protein
VVNFDTDHFDRKGLRISKINRRPTSQSGHESFDPRNTSDKIPTIGSSKVEGQYKPQMFRREYESSDLRNLSGVILTIQSIKWKDSISYDKG